MRLELGRVVVAVTVMVVGGEMSKGPGEKVVYDGNGASKMESEVLFSANFIKYSSSLYHLKPRTHKAITPKLKHPTTRITPNDNNKMNRFHEVTA